MNKSYNDNQDASCKTIVISVFCPVFSGSTYFSLLLESALKEYGAVFVGELNRLDIPENTYRDYDVAFAKSKSCTTAKEAILEIGQKFWDTGNISSFPAALSSLIDRGHRVIIEDSKHADWHDYFKTSAIDHRYDFEWINIVLFRQPQKWLKSFLQALPLSAMQALLEQYVIQYAYYLDNQENHPGDTFFVSFDDFLVDAHGVLSVLSDHVAQHLKVEPNLGQGNKLYLPNAIGGNLKSYHACHDFPLDLLNSASSEDIFLLVDRFFSHETDSHNRDYANALTESIRTMHQESRTRSSPAAFVPLESGNFFVRKVIRDLYQILSENAINSAPTDGQ